MSNSVTERLVAETVNTVTEASDTLASMLGEHSEESERITQLALGLTDGLSTETIPVGLKAACIIWLDAMVLSYALELDVKMVDREHSPSERVNIAYWSKIWEPMLNTKYASIFQFVIELLPKITSPNDLDPVIAKIHAQASKISHVEEASNICGEAYAKVLTTIHRKQVAAYYTKYEVSEYMSTLLMPEADSLPDVQERWRIADFACGTGVLLRSAYRRMQSIASEKHANMGDLREHMSEIGITGADISKIASHLASTNLMRLQPGYNYKDITCKKLGRIRLVPETIEDVHTGSLELVEETACHNSYDIIVMNPPYSRTRKGESIFDVDGITSTERNLLQQRIQTKIKPKIVGNMKAGLGSLFAGLADIKLKQGGKLGIILPMSVAAQSSWDVTREMISTGYSDIVVTYFDIGLRGNDAAMSADTGMGEILITARKGDQGTQGIVYVCLNKPFSSAEEASEVAMRIYESISNSSPGDKGQILIKNEPIGNWYWHHTSKGTWAGAGMSDLSKLFPIANNLIKGRIKTYSDVKHFPVVQMQDVFTVGPSCASIGYIDKVGKSKTPGSARGVFAFMPKEDKCADTDLSMWASNHTTQTSVIVEPTHYGVEREGKTKEAEARRSEKTDLFYQTKVRWTSQRVLACRTETPVMGGTAWAGLRCEDEIVKYACAVWANSVFGFLCHWTLAGRQQRGRSATKIRDIRKLLIPDFRDPMIRQRAEAIWNTNPFLLTIPLDRANKADMDIGRRELDIAAGRILGLSALEADLVAGNLAELWCSESSVQ